jgi:hypothetical protein
MTTLFTLLAFFFSLSPHSQPFSPQRLELAQAITLALQEGGPLFAHDDDLTRSAALMAAVAFREGSFELGVVGDHGQSIGTFQLYGRHDLSGDVRAQAKVAHAMLRASITTDRSHPVAQYARGPRWASLEAQRISNDRMALAKRLASGNLER